MMKVKQLRLALAKLPDDMVVVLRRGRESDHAALAVDCQEAMFVPHDTAGQGFVFGLSEVDSLGERAIRALVIR